MATKIYDIEGISKLGTTGEAATLKELDAIERVLVSFMNGVQKRASENLDKEGSNASASLRQSIIVLPIQAYGKTYEIALQMNDYWKFVNEGVQGWQSTKAPNSPFRYKRGKRPPRAAIEQWITNKGINPGGRRGERMDPRASLAKAIARKIGREGTKPTKFLDKALPEELIKTLTNEVAEAIGRQISISIVL